MMISEKIRIKKTEYNDTKKRLCEGFELMNRTVAEKGQVVFFGDSITEFLQAGDWYGDYAREKGKALYNRGIGGDTSNRLFERTRKNVTCIDPCCVVILIGTNDLDFGFDGEFVKSNVEKTLYLIKADCPDCKIILQAIYPVSHSLKGCAGKRQNDEILKTNEKLRLLAEKYKVTYLDFTKLLSDKKGELKKEYTYDGLHLSPKGYEVTTAEIKKHLP